MGEFDIDPQMYLRNRRWVKQYLRNLKRELHEGGEEGEGDVQGKDVDPTIMMTLAIFELIDVMPFPGGV